MSKNFSQIIADLVAKPEEGKDLSSRLQQLGAEVRNVIQSEDTVFGKFRGLVESFREIIPDEQQRHQAALKALSTTSKLSKAEIIKAMGGQAEELKVVEKNVMPALAGWRDELKAMEARSKELKSETAKLRERIAQLEGEEITIRAAMVVREKDLAAAEKTIQELFAGIGAEIIALKNKMEGIPAESPTPPKGIPKNAAPAPETKKEKESEQKSEPPAPPPMETKFQKKCPMCGGPFNLIEIERKWQCYTCAYEELDR